MKTMLPSTTPAFFTNWQGTSFQCDTARTMDDLRNALQGGTVDEYTFPDVFEPALRLHGILSRTLTQDSIDKIVQRSEVECWFKTLVAVLTSDSSLLCHKVINLNDNQNTQIFLRVLYRSMRDFGVGVPYITLFMHKTNSGDEVPVAFTYPGIKIGLCPAVQLLGDKQSVEQFLGQLVNHGGILSDENPFQKIQNDPNECKSIRDFFRYSPNTVHPIFDTSIQEAVDAIGQEIQVGDPNVAPLFLNVEWLSSPNPRAPEAAGFFTDKLLLFRRNNNGGNRYLIPVVQSPADAVLAPIRKSCASGNYVSIYSSMKCRKQGEDYVVSFDFGGKTYRRLYKKSDVVEGDNNNNMLDLLSVWPDKEAACWNRYFVYVRTKWAGDPVGGYYSASVYDGSAWHDVLPRHDSRNGELDYAAEVGRFPKLISIHNDSEEFGMIFLSDVLSVEASVGRGQMGVDFGTSNTIAYLRDNQQFEPIKVQDHRIVCIGEKNSYDLAFNFMPNGNTGSTLPYRTVLHTVGNLAAQQSYQAVFSAVAPLQYDNDLTDAYRRNLDDNMKWPDPAASNDGNSASKTQAFLEHLMLLWLWEVVSTKGLSSVDCVFTYPASLPDNVQDNFKKQVVQHVRGKMPSGIIAQVQYATEAEAIGPFIASPQVQSQIRTEYNGYVLDIDKGMLLLDIGGGSVDVSVWQTMTDDRNHRRLGLCFETSFGQFAGNYMQVEQVFDNNHRRESLLIDLTGDGENLPAVLNRLKKSVGVSTHDEFRRDWAAATDELVKQIIALKGSNQHEARDKYVFQIELYFYFLSFAAGCMIGEAMQSGLVTRCDRPSTSFTVLLAGNGALMYKLVDTDKTTFFKQNLKMLGSGIKASGVQDLDYTYNFITSPVDMHKHEVAYGAANFSISNGSAANGNVVAFDPGADDSLLVRTSDHAWNVASVKIEPLRQKAIEYINAYVDALELHGILTSARIADTFKSHKDAASIKAVLESQIMAITNVQVGATSQAFDKLSQVMVEAFKKFLDQVDLPNA